NSRTDLFGIAYQSGSTSVLRFANQNSGGAWSKQTIDATRGAGYISCAYDTSGRPSVAYYSSPTADLRFALLKKGKWLIQSLATKGTVGQYANLTYNHATGRARVIYYDRTHDQTRQMLGVY